MLAPSKCFLGKKSEALGTIEEQAGNRCFNDDFLDLYGTTAIDVDHFTGDEARLLRSQKEDEIGHIFGIAGPLDNLNPIEPLLEDVMSPVWIVEGPTRGSPRHDLTRTHAVDSNVVFAPNPGHVSRQRFDTGFRSPVG